MYFEAFRLITNNRPVWGPELTLKLGLDLSSTAVCLNIGSLNLLENLRNSIHTLPET